MTRARHRLLMLAAAGWLCSSACSLAVDTSDLDRGCPGQKECDGKCVPKDSPAYGCSPNLCEPCPLPNAEPECLDGACHVAACLAGFGCDDCSKFLYIDPKNCGFCGNVCASGNSCVGGVCQP